LGWVYFKQGRYDEALTLLQRAVSLVPDDPIILEHLGDVYVQVQNKSKALWYYRKALERKGAQDDTANLRKKIDALSGEGF
jgi:Flp pilus assembly protein TadD